MQHHFVVSFDTETNEWTVETDIDVFMDGTIWDDTATEWSHAIDDGDTYTKDEELYDTLNKLVRG